MYYGDCGFTSLFQLVGTRQTFKQLDVLFDLWFNSVGDQVNSQAAGRSCWSGALVESAACWVECSRWGCCTAVTGKRCMFNKLCVYRRECNYHIITQPISMWLYRIMFKKKSAAGRYSRSKAAACSHTLKFFGEITSGERRVLRACRLPDLAEKLKAWHLETIGWAAYSTFVSVLTSNKSLHIVRPSRSRSDTVSRKLKGICSDG